MLWQGVVNGLSAGSGYALIALGFGLIFQSTRFFNLNHGAVLTAAAYLYFLLVVPLMFPWPIALVTVIAAAAVLGCASELGVFRPLRKSRTSTAVPLIASLGLLIVVTNLISLLFGDETRSLNVDSVPEGFILLGAHITRTQIIMICTGLALSVSVWAFLKLTRLGKMIRAVSADNELSLIVGIDRDQIVLGIFALGSALAAVAGILIGYDTNLVPVMGFKAILIGVVAFIIGGTGSVLGALPGGLFVGLVQHLGILVLPTEWQDAIVYVLLILFLLVRPQGFLGERLRSATV